MNKTTIILIVANLVRLPENITFESEVEIEATDGVESSLFLQEKLDRPINEKINAHVTIKTRTRKDITSVIKRSCYI